MNAEPQALPVELLAFARRATRSADEGDWCAAASAWAELADRAIELGRVDLARSALHEALEALRRDDRPGASVALLNRAADLAEGPDARAVLKLQLGAALLDAGFLEPAERECRESLAMGPPPLRPIVADTLAGVLLARGDLLGLRGVVAQLVQESSGMSAVAARFREAQLQRLDGRLDGAREGFLAVCDALESIPRAAGAVASALVELAELELLCRQTEAALVLFDRAEQAWRGAGRVAGQLQVLAGRALALVESGAMFLPGLLDEPIAYAEARGLVALEARLRLSRGLCRHKAGSLAADADLESALLLADTVRSPWLAGRIRYERHRCGLSQDPGELQLAVDQLTGNLPWSSRASLALARTSLPQNPALTMRAAGRLVCRFAMMGMEHERAEAEELVRRAMP